MSLRRIAGLLSGRTGHAHFYGALRGVGALVLLFVFVCLVAYALLHVSPFEKVCRGLEVGRPIADAARDLEGAGGDRRETGEVGVSAWQVAGLLQRPRCTVGADGAERVEWVRFQRNHYELP